jgi:hypothetical protein
MRQESIKIQDTMPDAGKKEMKNKRSKKYKQSF